MSDTDVPMVAKWMGRDIRELSRDELIEALGTMGRLYHEALQDNLRSSETMRLLLHRASKTGAS